ncbi:MAG: glutamate-1-semialdehyde 2,1-aminomutase [Desulfurococcales archaeon]|nr:glutamate-1-semialdehyde 2,1-aminomutase [Desulfurococcales archaeon]
MGSRKLYRKAKEVFPGGVNSPVRALVEPEPFYVAEARGPYLYTVDGEKLLDMVLGYGPLILGHRHPRVEEAIRSAVGKGWLYGAPSPLEVELAEKILAHVKPGGMIRFVNTGTEATMTAIRLARGYTGRRLILKFDGNYHGSHDQVLVAAGSAAGELGVPSSSGVPREVANLTLVARYNDLHSVEDAFRRHGDEIAAVIVEPVAANMGVIPPVPGFLDGLRRITRSYGALLIFDEVVTGFRISLGGAQEYYGVEADIVTLGKVIGGGMPIGAVVAEKRFMEHLTPTGKVFNAGTFNAHPLAMAAGLATLEVLEKEIQRASEAMRGVVDVLCESASRLGVEYTINRVESMAQIFLGTSGPVENAEHARSSDNRLYKRLHHYMRLQGVFIAPSQMEAIFASTVHTSQEIELFQEAVGKALKRALEP